MKQLLLSTAFLGLAALPGWAQDQAIFREAPEDLELRASDFMGMRLYASEAAVEGDEIAGVQEGWDDVGEVNDIILDRDGSVQAVLVDIGGFLGIGARQVAVSMEALRFVSDSATAENLDDFFLVINTNREALENAPEYTAGLNEEMTAEQAAEETEQVIDEGAAATAAAGAAAGAAVEGAVEETGDAVANVGAEIGDEVSDAGEEVTEEAAQADMTDVQEDQAEVADAQADAAEEATEETAQAEGTATETEMETDQTAEAATDEVMTDEMAATDEAPTDEAMTEDMAATDEAATADPAATDMAATDEMAATEGAEAGATDEVTGTELTSAEREPIAREGFVAATAEDFTADRLQGAGVFDANDERIGEVGEILLSEDGQVTDLVIDVGGFLGIGEKPVALTMDSVDILRSEQGEEIRVFVSQTEDELEQMERYEAQ